MALWPEILALKTMSATTVSHIQFSDQLNKETDILKGHFLIELLHK